MNKYKLILGILLILSFKCNAQDSDSIISFTNYHLSKKSFDIRIKRKNNVISFDPYYSKAKEKWNPIHLILDEEHRNGYALNEQNHWVDLSDSDSINLLIEDNVIINIHKVSFGKQFLYTFNLTSEKYEGASHTNTFYIDLSDGLIAIKNSTGFYFKNGSLNRYNFLMSLPSSQ